MAHRLGTPYQALLNKSTGKNFWRGASGHFAYPDVLRWRGSVLLNTLPGVVVTTLFSCIVCVLHLQFGVAMDVPVSVLSTVSVALGLLLAFRVNTAYDRYWEGRKLIQTVMATIRNLTRQVWINIPEQSHGDHVEKMRCVKLLLAFMVATKHHLRGEYGTDYDDLKSLLPPGWVPCSVTHAPVAAAAAAAASQQKKRRLFKAVPIIVSLYHSLRPSKYKQDDAELDSDDRNDAVNIPRSVVREAFPDSDLAYAKTTADLRRIAKERDDDDEAIVHGVYGSMSHNGNHSSSSNNNNNNTQHRPHQAVFTSEEDLPDHGDADIALPLEILFLVALYVNQAKRSNKIESNFVSVVTSSLDTLVNALTAFERISTTPVPRAYNIHLKQGVILYIFFLPFALVNPLAWLVTPIVALVSFTLFGIEAIGAEIENPFGYDYNDLPLNTYCEELKREVAYIIYHIPTHSKSILLDGH
ncbi:Bestrophin, RFP-TM, chloride channel-domain-containing protein [Zychaea mexicana]|uniref:Bestrophin, RFP-TM, chloride channel-domain-containing protein n=1 Tax=Zychaea mexicana TaxID=64656 RepID=UPI0022FEFF40|nr:Bestrophin, RFP-TM, chloride channel-domain-containing protein [Zychaea mexicana]KAI9498515.1 Bestrophin, RFP-TM, chloride channel-domain-containing protein [Zychaea mexicana]